MNFQENIKAIYEEDDKEYDSDFIRSLFSFASIIPIFPII